jgi:3-isopropylmalate/(R)-2-methylmalate dehydratase small subunit
MRPFTSLTARGCPLPYANIDTDQLIPARFMRRPRAQGYGPFLLHDLRRGADGEPDPKFPLNAPAYMGAQILVARRNFGGGSSREAAVYALADFGFRVVIAPSFGDIFASSAIKNGLLPARVDEAEAELLLAALGSGEADALTVDLAAQTIRCGQTTAPFAIDAVWKQQLLNGWDDIDLTLNEAPSIAAFFASATRARPWAAPRRPTLNGSPDSP